MLALHHTLLRLRRALVLGLEPSHGRASVGEFHRAQSIKHLDLQLPANLCSCVMIAHERLVCLSLNQSLPRGDLFALKEPVGVGR